MSEVLNQMENERLSKPLKKKMGELGEGCFQPFPSTDIDTCEG